MKSIIHGSARFISQAVALGLAGLGVHTGTLAAGLAAPKAPKVSRYNAFKGNTAEIEEHNRRIDAGKQYKASKGSVKKSDARFRKYNNLCANPAYPR